MTGQGLAVGVRVTIRGEQGVGVITDILPNHGGLYRVVRERTIGGRVERVIRWEWPQDLFLWEAVEGCTDVDCEACRMYPSQGRN
jgi:hypothetical protein